MINKIKKWAETLKRQGRILQLVFLDSRTPAKAKILIWISLGYMFSPIDLIPDFIPVLGLLDDLIILPLLIALAIKLVPKPVYDDAITILKNQSPEKWKPHWMIILFIGIGWTAGFFLIYRIAGKYF